MKTAGSGTKSMQSIGQASIVPADVPLSSSPSNLDLHSEAREYPAPLFSPSNFSFPHLSNPQMLMPIAMHLREDRSIRRRSCGRLVRLELKDPRRQQPRATAAVSR
jgi:hypothetical protein